MNEKSQTDRFLRDNIHGREPGFSRTFVMISKNRITDVHFQIYLSLFSEGL